MENLLYSIGGILIPFIGTTFGSSFVFFMRKNMSEKFQKMLVGFASGVMIAASIWSLILPAIEMAENQGKVSWLPAAVGFALGIVFLILINQLAEKMEAKNDGKKLNMLLFSVTLHNIPEGMAVGVVFAGMMVGNQQITFMSAFALALGIAIQNFPEGAIISMPLQSEGTGKKKAFIYGTLSGIVEPIASLITILLSQFIIPILPYLLSFAAGAMIYVVIEELIPEASIGKHSNIATIGFAVGFVMMMILDVALG